MPVEKEPEGAGDHPATPSTDESSRAASPGDAPPADAGAESVSSDQVRLALRKVKDPELNLNIVDLGLVYGIEVEGDHVKVDMTLTSPGCPAGAQIMGDVERQVVAMDGVSLATVNLVWEPFWSPDRIEPRVRAYMGL
jgi:metal-sulfur cluster biosynthetic enzyme